MTWIDWAIVAVPLVVVAWIGWRTQRYMKAVSDFLTGGRVAGRYIVAVAGGTAGMGLITVVAYFEMYYRAGFVLGFWESCMTPVMLIVALTGYGVYRYRETRAMTLAQFFEVRYSRSFRVFAGFLAWVSGVINYAIFPAVGARFVVFYGGLPERASLLGFTFPTAAAVMAIFLGVAVVIVLVGGQLTTMVTDCVAGLFSFAMYTIVVVTILCLFSWSQMTETMLARPAGESMLNPFDAGKVQEFNMFYIVAGVLGNVYNILSWQGSQGYNAAASSPHEQKMGKVLGMWRAGMSTLMIMLLAMAAFTYMHHTSYADGAAAVESELASRISADSPVVAQTLHDQMVVPIAIKHFLPVGVSGAFFAVMIFLMISTDTTYLHSWGSILVQDVIQPIRGKPLSPERQILLLRLSIVLVAVFAFVFSLVFNQVTFILMFMALTGSIWMGGAGSVIVGGLYTRWGTTAGAWAGMLSGTSLAVVGFAVTQFWADPIYPYLSERWPDVLAGFTGGIESLGDTLPLVYWRVTAEKFPISGQEIYFLTILVAIAAYGLVSWLTCRQPFNLERMLHRGEYAHPDDRDEQLAIMAKPLKNWKRVLLGFDEHFTWGDKCLAVGVMLYSMALFVVFLGVLIWDRLVSPLTDKGWANYFWVMSVCLALSVGLVTTVWFTIGGIRDLRRMFRRLAAAHRNALDDGRVIGHANADDPKLGTMHKKDD